MGGLYSIGIGGCLYGNLYGPFNRRFLINTTGGHLYDIGGHHITQGWDREQFI